jgi:hypothetical protein
MFKDLHLNAFYTRNLPVIGEAALLTAISTCIQEDQHKYGNWDEGFLTDGMPWEQTINQANKYYKADLLIRIQDRLWKEYETKLKLMEPVRTNNRTMTDIAYANEKAIIDDAKVVYKLLCYGVPKPKQLYDNTGQSIL